MPRVYLSGVFLRFQLSASRDRSVGALLASVSALQLLTGLASSDPAPNQTERRGRLALHIYSMMWHFHAALIGERAGIRSFVFSHGMIPRLTMFC
jgi:hypothetical protein